MDTFLLSSFAEHWALLKYSVVGPLLSPTPFNYRSPIELAYYGYWPVNSLELDNTTVIYVYEYPLPHDFNKFMSLFFVVNFLKQ